MATTIRFGGYQGDKSVHTRAADVFCSAVRRQLGDRVNIIFERNIVADGQQAADLLTRTETGDLDGCYFSSSYLTQRVPDLGLFDQHFVIPDRAHGYALLDGGVGARLAVEVANRTGFKVLAYWDNGLRHLSSARGPILRPSDCAGLKIRTLANEQHQRVFRALGFEPLTIDVRDLPEAVASLRVDAQENPLTNIYNFALHTTHRHITLTTHLLGVALVLFNQRSVDAWPEAVRQAVFSALGEASIEQRRMAQQDDQICSAAIQAEGGVVHRLSPVQRAEFIAATRLVVEAMRSDFSAEFIHLFESDIARVSV